MKNSQVALDQDEFKARYNDLTKRYDALQKKLSQPEKRRKEREQKADAIGGFLFRLRELDQPLEYFDDRLWLEVIDTVVVHPDGKLTFKFRNNKEVVV